MKPSYGPVCSCLQQLSTRHLLMSNINGNTDSSAFKDVPLGCYLIPRVLSTADILYSTSVMFIGRTASHACDGRESESWPCDS